MYVQFSKKNKQIIIKTNNANKKSRRNFQMLQVISIIYQSRQNLIGLLFYYHFITIYSIIFFFFITNIPMQIQHNQSNALVFLLINDCKASTLFLRFLSNKQLLNLPILNREISEYILNKGYFVNKLFYDRYLNFDKTMYYDFNCDQEYLNLQHKKLFSIFQNSQSLFLNQLKAFKFFRNQLVDNLSMFLPLQKSYQITSNIFNILKDPCLPLPKLRRQTVGTYCTSPLQIFIAELNWSGRVEQDQQQMFLQLKSEIFEHETQILEFFQSAKNQHLIKEIRYKPEIIAEYKQTQSPFINIILLLLKLIDSYLDSLALFFQSLTHSNSLFDLFVQFLLRFNSYRSCILELEEKLSFLFVHFNETFQCVYSNYCKKPSFGLWRFMIKKWSEKMSKFHDGNNKVFLYILMKQGDNRISKFMDQKIKEENEKGEYPIFDNESQYKLLKSKKIFEIYFKQNFPDQTSIQYFDQHQQYNSLFLNDYSDYLVDISINQITVHWCGSSQQILGTQYMNLENAISDQNYEYLKYCYHILQNLVVSKKIYQQYLLFLNDHLKARTIKRINQQTNQFLVDLKSIIQQKYTNFSNNLYQSELNQYQCIKDWKTFSIQFDDIDQRVKYLNNQREMSQDIVDQYPMFFNIDESVDMQTLEKMVKQQNELDESFGDTKEFTQSFVSHQSSKMEEQKGEEKDEQNSRQLINQID